MNDPGSWQRFFQNEVNPDTVREVVSELIDNRKFNEVIACIEQAILSGQIQPWMHQVLALSMQAVGKPKAQIERVLLSSQDLITNDPDSMMQLAAYLVRFDRVDHAIELYRQAASLDPTRPEPYVRALELAVRTKNYVAVAWSAPEVLSFSWTKGREELSRKAEQAAAEAIPALMNNGNYPLAVELQSGIRAARQLDLSIRLEWSGVGDIDIQITEPGGTECSIIKPMTEAGGIFIHDGFGPRQDQCYEEYLCPQARRGEYRIKIRHNSGDIVGKRARLTIVRDRGTKNETSVAETIFLGPKDQTVRLFLSHGRRQAGNAAVIDQKQDDKQARPVSIFAQLGAGGGVGQIGQRSAVGFSPVITNVSEGVFLGAMATVSGDRRYVRVSASPMFSAITDVFTFSYVK